MKKILTVVTFLFSFLAFSTAFANENSIKKVLITGFAPFGGEATNPSFEAVKALPDNIDGAQIIKKELPVSFEESIAKLKEYIKEYNPDLIICVGQAGGRYNISVERVAINIDDARIPDNDGNKPIDTKIFANGENAYFSKLPIKAIAQNINKSGVPAEVSNTAGTYVCNHIMYALLYELNKNYPNKSGGFIHVPYSTEQAVDKVNTPSMSIEDMTKALAVAIKTSISTGMDIKVTAGKES
ncbi:pyroglutamyl-peptidase I [Pseudofrancisella aestuarii]|uniref:Pyrrolidone-carboxylate peptidase n=1 Tax=Pseudofrancisella aestuarii TaxID=2670347 RepID=A0ABV9TDM2_9GAMM|nr:pyroglutamyl-peptidase I [Pseudofrancisella aestuarii]